MTYSMGNITEPAYCRKIFFIYFIVTAVLSAPSQKLFSRFLAWGSEHNLTIYLREHKRGERMLSVANFSLQNFYRFVLKFMTE